MNQWQSKEVPPDGILPVLYFYRIGNDISYVLASVNIWPTTRILILLHTSSLTK